MCMSCLLLGAGRKKTIRRLQISVASEGNGGFHIASKFCYRSVKRRKTIVRKSVKRPSNALFPSPCLQQAESKIVWLRALVWLQKVFAVCHLCRMWRVVAKVALMKKARLSRAFELRLR